MAFNTLEYLRDGKVDFVFHCTPYDYEHLIESIRKAPNRIEIIHGFLSKLKVDLPSFCFSVIYDMPDQRQSLCGGSTHRQHARRHHQQTSLWRFT